MKTRVSLKDFVTVVDMKFRIGPVFKHFKVKKIWPWLFLKFLESALIWIKKVRFTKKILVRKAQSSLKSNFWLNYGKQCLHKTVDFWTLMQLNGFIFLLEIGEKIWNYRKCQEINKKNLSLDENGPSYDQTFVCWDHPDKKHVKRNPVKLERHRNVWYVLLRTFWLL